jgi:hypothetical protein
MPRPEPKIVCKHCGSERIEVEFTAQGTGSAIFAVQRGGEVYLAEVEDHSFDHHQETDMFICRGCGKSSHRASDLVQATPAGAEHLKPGDIVFLPDGFKGVVATVDYEDYTFTAEGWHETFEFHEAQLIDPAAMFVRAA